MKINNYRFNQLLIYNENSRAKNHPKLYLWSKPWDKPSLPEKEELKEEPKLDEPQSVLLSLLKAPKDDHKLKDEELPVFPKLDINSLIDNNLDQLPTAPIIPQPEAAIEADDCQINLLDHISHYQSLVEQRLDDFESQIKALEDALGTDDEMDDMPKVRQTTEMVMRDINTLNEFAHINTF